MVFPSIRSLQEMSMSQLPRKKTLTNRSLDFPKNDLRLNSFSKSKRRVKKNNEVVLDYPIAS
tara:strand:- start:42 stop:227 length:186 start_codon:yes stop_codon:yes gene_type:complete